MWFLKFKKFLKQKLLPPPPLLTFFRAFQAVLRRLRGWLLAHWAKGLTEGPRMWCCLCPAARDHWGRLYLLSSVQGPPGLHPVMLRRQCVIEEQAGVSCMQGKCLNTCTIFSGLSLHSTLTIYKLFLRGCKWLPWSSIKLYERKHKNHIWPVHSSYF